MPLPGLGDRARTSKSSAAIQSGAMNADDPPNSYRERVREKMQTTPRGGEMNPSDDRYNNSNFYDNRAPIDLNITREFTFFRPSSSRNQTDRLASARSARTPRGQSKRDIIIYNRTYADGNEDENEVNLEEDNDDDQDVRANGRVKSGRAAAVGQNRMQDQNNDIKRRNSILANRPESRESFYSNGNNNAVPASPRIRSSYLTRRISRQANGEDDIRENFTNRPVKTPRQQLGDLEINGSRYNLNNPMLHQNGGVTGSKISQSRQERYQNQPEEVENTNHSHHNARYRTNSPNDNKFASNSRVNFGNGAEYEESFVNEETNSAYNSRSGSPDYRPVPKPRRLDLSNKTNLNLTNESDGFKIKRHQSATVTKAEQTGKPRPTTPRLGNMPVPSPRSSLGFNGAGNTRNLAQQDEYFSRQRERNKIMTSYMQNNNQQQLEPTRLRTTSRRIIDELSDESALAGSRDNAARSVSRSMKLDAESRSSRRNSINQSWK